MVSEGLTLRKKEPLDSLQSLSILLSSCDGATQKGKETSQLAKKVLFNPFLRSKAQRGIWGPPFF